VLKAGGSQWSAPADFETLANAEEAIAASPSKSKPIGQAAASTREGEEDAHQSVKKGERGESARATCERARPRRSRIPTSRVLERVLTARPTSSRPAPGAGEESVSKVDPITIVSHGNGVRGGR